MAMAMAEMDVDAKVLRATAHYISFDEKFELRTERYKGQQYSHLYYCRLHKLREMFDPLVRRRWPAFPVRTILGLEEGKRCVLIGTIYKDMKLKPSILDEYSKERSKVALAAPHNFLHPDDHLVLEDESGRVRLSGSLILPSVYVTGIVLAVCGEEGQDGAFHVHGILDPGLPPQRTVAPPVTDDKYVALVSGLRIGNDSCNPLFIQLLVDLLTGHLGEREVQSMNAKVVHLVIAGDSAELQNNSLNGQSVNVKDQTELSEPVAELDLVLTQLVSAMPVDIMPGANDPANFTLPQQPFHRCLFPAANSYNTFHCATNPHHFSLDGVEFLGTSGQSIDDLGKYSEAKDVLEFMERTLCWRHLAPTAPDTLGCYPFTDKDPFAVENCPHVYFCGNQKTFMTRVIKGTDGQCTRLVAIPRFSETGTAVLINLKNLEYHLLTLSSSSLIREGSLAS